MLNPSVAEVFMSLARHPYHHLVVRWNWKSAVTSALARGFIFFAANWSAGINAAFGAMLAEFTYRAFLAGACGSITQSLRKARPVWAATLAAVAALPLVSHAVEFSVHWLRGTPKLATSIIASISFTVLTTLFSLYAMRHGVLVVTDEDRKTLLDDVALMPRVLAGFITSGPLLLWRFLHPPPEVQPGPEG